MNTPNETTFDVSDFFEFHDWIEDDPAFPSMPESYRNLPISPNFTTNQTVVSNDFNLHEGTTDYDTRESGVGKKMMREKVAFKTKSEIEVLDDGFKWRKYGKKMVKNSPNPRNYYKCSVEGCLVKKRVERDIEDPRYVVTTYEGIHNHQGPHSVIFDR